jgi:predicted nuclease of predicted toxin-antitoxin system
MGLPRRACEDLQAIGIEAVHLGTLGMTRLPDAEVIEHAVQEGCIVVTLDRDFTQLVALSGTHVPSGRARRNKLGFRQRTLRLGILELCSGRE